MSEKRTKGTPRAKSGGKIANRSRNERFRLRALVDSGLSEYKGLAELFPGDRNRTQRWKIWQKSGLWPVSDQEIADHRQDYELIKAEIAMKMRQKTGSEVTGIQPQENTSFDFDLPSAITSYIKNQIVTLMGQLAEGETRAGSQLQRQLPPRPPRMGARKAGSREHIGGTLDSELALLVEQEKRERGLNTSEILDAALWHYFGKPLLSFEIEGDELSRPTKPEPGRKNARKLTKEELFLTGLPNDLWISVVSGSGEIEILLKDPFLTRDAFGNLRLEAYPRVRLMERGVYNDIDDRVKKLEDFWSHGRRRR